LITHLTPTYHPLPSLLSVLLLMMVFGGSCSSSSSDSGGCRAALASLAHGKRHICQAVRVILTAQVPLLYHLPCTLVTHYLINVIVTQVIPFKTVILVPLALGLLFCRHHRRRRRRSSSSSSTILLLLLLWQLHMPQHSQAQQHARTAAAAAAAADGSSSSLNVTHAHRSHQLRQQGRQLSSRRLRSAETSPLHVLCCCCC
jgi:hypothetical protein